MKIINWDSIEKNKNYFKAITNGTALSIGGFDGPHLGHYKIFESVINNANVNNLTPGIITFTKSPKSLASKKYLGDVSSLNLKLKKIKEKGFQFVVLIDFSLDFSTITGDNFVDFLVNTIRMKYLVVGSDFRCGYRQDTGVDELHKMSAYKGFCFDSKGQIEIDGIRVSSSAVRKAIQSGDFSRAKTFLGYPYLLDLTELKWSTNSNKLKAKKRCFSQVLPKNGRYNAVLILKDNSKFKVSVKISNIFIIITWSFKKLNLQINELCNIMFIS